MTDEYPEVPAHFARALQFTLGEAEVLEVWQSLCDEYGERHLYQDGDLIITIRASMPEEDA